eukprot:g5192.t1
MTLFSETIPFIVRASNIEEEEEVTKHDFIVEVSYEQPHHQRVLRICIYSEEDSNVFHILDMNESNYDLQVKMEQGMEVEFEDFSKKLISLFQRCKIEHSNFIVELKSESKGEGVSNRLAIEFFEINDFTHLSHLKLSFRQATNQSVTSFLTSRLNEVIKRSKAFQTQLDQSQIQLARLQETCEAKEELIGQLRTKCENLMLEVESKGPNYVTPSILETTPQAHNHLNHVKSKTGKSSFEAKLPEQIEALLRHIKQLELSNKKLLDENSKLDSECLYLSKQLASVEGASIAWTRDEAVLLETNRKLKAEKQQLHVELIKAIAENQSLSKRIDDAEDVIGLQKRRIQELEDPRSSDLECQCKELKLELARQEQLKSKLNSKLEEQFSIVQKLSTELRFWKDRTFKKAILDLQEEKVFYKDRKEKEMSTSMTPLKNKTREVQTKSESRPSEIECLKTKLMKSNKQTNGNESMSQKLSKQVDRSKSKNPLKSSSLNIFPASFCRFSFLAQKTSGLRTPTLVEANGGPSKFTFRREVKN